MDKQPTAPAPFAFEPWELSQIIPAEQRAAYRDNLGQRVEEYYRANGRPWPPERDAEKDAAAIAEALGYFRQLDDPEQRACIIRLRQQVACILINTGYMSDE